MQTLSRPLIRAVLIAAAASLTVVALAQAGLGAQASLAAGLVLAGGCRIAGLAALNGGGVLPTSPVPIGDI